MPRLPRIQLDGVLYVITARGISPEPIFKDAADYDTYLNLLADYQERYGFTLFGYCLLPDHVHLCLETKAGTTVSSVMHDLTASYTRYFNKRYGRSGHLFQARFRDTVTEKALYLVPVTAYLHRHPVSSGLVDDGRDYAYSSYGLYLKHAAGAATRMAMDAAIQEAMDLLRATGIAESDYAVYVRGMSDIDLNNLRQALHQKILGSDTFVQDITQRAQGGPPPQRAVRAAEPVTVGLPPRRGFRLALVGCAASLVMAIAAHVAVLMQRVASLEQTVLALSQENEASFKAHSALATQSDELASLEGTQWQIRLTPMYAMAAGSQPTASQEDQLAFDERQVMSKTLASQGFAHSNYTMTAQTGSRAIWETMQSNAQGEVICWRGEWQGTKMRGMMTRQPVGKSAENYTFVGVANQVAGKMRREI